MIVVGAGQISMAIARRVGAGKKIILGDKNIENAKNIQKTMVDAGFDVEVIEMDLSSRQDILKMIDMAKNYGPTKHFLYYVCDRPTLSEQRRKLKLIEEFYSRLDYMHLKTFFENQQLFYRHILACPSDLSQEYKAAGQK